MPRFPFAALTALLLLTACGEEKPSSTEPQATVESPDTTPVGTEQTLESGLSYKVLKSGNGEKPTLADYVTVHFKVMRADGTLIDDSRIAGDPQTLLVSQTLPGWQEVLPLMDEGAEWRANIPASLAFGESGLGEVVGPNEPLVFDIELIRVETEEEWRTRRLAEEKEQEKTQMANQQYLEENKKKDGVKVLPSGLQYEILEDGTGKHPAATDIVKVHYRGTLIDGTEFDSSYKRGEPAEFPVNRLIKGWQEALPLMKEGSKWRLVIPSDLAYGDRAAGGLIGPGSTLVFEMELLKVL